MRYRSTTLTRPISAKRVVYTSVKYRYGTFPDYTTETVVVGSTTSCRHKTSAIYDEVGPYRPTRSRRRRSSVETWNGSHNMPQKEMPVMRQKRCSHACIDYDLNRSVSIKYTSYPNWNHPTLARTVQTTYAYDHALEFASGHVGIPVNTIYGANPGNSSGPYYEIDWFALTQAFNEACERIIPQEMFLGEMVAEGGIYFDAIKAILNPSSLIPSLLKKFSSTRFRRKNLGDLYRAGGTLSSDLSSTYLGYQFGVKPAIDEVVSVLSAHRKVKERLKYLSENGGSWVPIRVRQPRPSLVSDWVQPSGNQTVEWRTVEKSNVGTISGYGQIRERLSGDAAWQAYVQYFGLNKFVGLAWELIPFSFVVDWFTNAQEVINSVSRLSTDSPFIGITGICSSTKSERRDDLLYCPGGNPSLGMTPSDPSSPLSLGYRVVRSYERWPGIPSSGSFVVDGSTIGSFEATVGGALFFQKFGNRINGRRST